MESAALGLVLDSTVIIAAERKQESVVTLLTKIRGEFGEVEICISVITLAELVHGIGRARSAEFAARRRMFIDDLKRRVPMIPVTEASAELAGLISAQLALAGNRLGTEDLLIGVAALQLGYQVATLNLRHFERIPGLRVVCPTAD